MKTARATSKTGASDDIYEVRERASIDRESLGLRERHKIDKLERISAASLKLFSRDGYEQTTLRTIAKEAGIALGTIALYARDKRDLILLLFNQLIPPLLEQGRRNVGEEAKLADSLVRYFEPFYVAYGKKVTLYRMILGQIFSPDSAHAQENKEIRAELVADVTALIARAVERGECRAETDLAVQARSFFYLYFAAVRVWLTNDQADAGQGLAELRTLYEQHVRGLSA